MHNNKIYKISSAIIVLVWMVNGLFCKVLNLVPRHKLIVARILGEQHAALFTKAIGIAEILMGVWIISGVRSRLSAITQILVIAVMNCIEFIIAPDLLLWGKLNALFAFTFIVFICINEFKFKQLTY